MERQTSWLGFSSGETRALSHELSAWDGWAEKYGGPSEKISLTVSSVPPGEVAGFGAQSSGLQIKLNDRLTPAHLRQLFRHELAHAFLHTRLGPDLRESVLLQETFAQLLSGDDARLRREHGIPTSAEALRRLEKKNPQELEPAIARLLAHADTKARMESFLRELLDAPLPRQAGEEKLKAILAREGTNQLRGEVNFLVLDARTGELLASRGDLNRTHPIGSILKPVVLRLFPELLSTQRRGKGPEWVCPTASAGEPMSWREALQTSCNGFFLSGGKDLDWEKWRQHLSRFGIKGERAESNSIAEAIGLQERLQLSLSEVAALYREIGREQPEVLAALTDSLERGTLSHLEHSRHFKALGAQLKTGTVRTPRSEPVAGWLGGRIKDVYVFAFAPGQSGASLLKELRTIAEPWVTRKLDPAQVQVLGLVSPAALRIHCEAGNLVAGKRELTQATVNDFKPGDSFQCLRGPLLVRLPTNHGEVERRYYGRLTYSPPPLTGEAGFVRVKQARARRGSAWILETSERSYVARVLAAEMAGGRQETLKALALVVRQNLRSGRHKERPLCDTTHCQVFGTAVGGAKTLARYAAAYDSVATISLKEGLFSNFALGGSKPWRAKVSHSRIRRRTGVTGEAVSVARRGEDIWVNQLRFSCEEFRNLFALLSCPNSLSNGKNAVNLEGAGEGHGVGLDLLKADLLAANGLKYDEILAHFKQADH